MNCKWCGNVVNESDKFCQHCGGKLIDYNNQENIQVIEQSAEEQTTINQNNLNPKLNNSSNSEGGKANIGLVILSVFIPLAGLIIFLVKKDNDKKTAKASGIAALISFGVILILSIISIVIFITSTNRVVNDAFDGFQNIIEEAEKEINDNESELENFKDEVEDFGNKAEDFINGLEGTNATNDWKTYSVTVNNNVIKLPITFNDFSSVIDFKMKSSEEKSYISPNYYALVNLYKDEKLALYIEVLNDTEQDVLYKDAKVTRISQTKYQISMGADVFIFPGGLKAGQEITKDEIINLFGTPSDIRNFESDGYVSDTYSYYSDDLYTTTNNYIIKVVNGVIDELVLDHRHY